MKDFLLDENGDLFLGEDGDIKITDSIEQAIAIRLKWFLNEWRLGPNYGIPYYEEFFIKNPSDFLIEGRLRDAIESVDEVVSVKSISSSIDPHLRILRVKYTAVTTEGEIDGRLNLNA